MDLAQRPMNAQQHGGPIPLARSQRAAHEAAALSRLAIAGQSAQTAKTPAAHSELQQAVDAARELGVGWTKIGDVLGIARGSAYQRYRKRPST
jgi:hypothetical protein